jgi:hypothetical protein
MKCIRWTVSMSLVAIFAFAGCGGDDDGSGACEKTYDQYAYCYNFHDTADQTGEEICTSQGGSWSAGTSCRSLGYTTECSNGSWVKPSGTCP